MAWQVEFTPKARRALDSLDRQADPRILGQALRGDELGDFWKYRVGDYRIIADIVDKKVVI